ncbi:hypothetical protein Micbo1qcDRAFT_155130, partial [Microdochium bolleyi]
MADLSKSQRQKAAPVSEGAPRRPSITPFDPRRYVPESIREEPKTAAAESSHGTRHSISYSGPPPSEQQSRSSTKSGIVIDSQAFANAGPPRSAPATPYPVSGHGTYQQLGDLVASKDKTVAGSRPSLAIPPLPAGSLLSFPALDPGSAASSPAVSRNQSPDVSRHGLPSAHPPPPPPLKSALVNRTQIMESRETGKDGAAAAEAKRHRNSLVTSPIQDRGPTWEEKLSRSGASSSSTPSAASPSRSQSLSKSRKSGYESPPSASASASTASRSDKRRDSLKSGRKD